jgi:predicted RNA-binding Zn-ribbon protein involved in translation (DUF1610 family)
MRNTTETLEDRYRCWLYPELRAFDTREARTQAMRQCRKDLGGGWSSWLVLLGGVYLAYVWLLWLAGTAPLPPFLSTLGMSTNVWVTLTFFGVLALFAASQSLDVSGRRRRLRRRLREMLAQQGITVCKTCARDLTGNTSGVCPECGTATEPVSRRVWYTRPDRRDRIAFIVKAAMADLCHIPLASIPSSATMRSLWQTQFDGGDQVELLQVLEGRFQIEIKADWWQSNVGRESDLELTLDQFASKVARYVEVKLMSCVCCGYDLTGNTSGTCPECGEKLKGTTTT